MVFVEMIAPMQSKERGRVTPSNFDVKSRQLIILYLDVIVKVLRKVKTFTSNERMQPETYNKFEVQGKDIIPYNERKVGEVRA